MNRASGEIFYFYFMSANTIQRIFLGVCLLVILAAMLVLSGCRSLSRYMKDYKRSYTLAAVDQFGQRVEVGVTLEPKQAERMEVARKLEDEGVIARASTLTEDVERVPMQPAARQLAILTAPAEPDREGTRGLLSAPASPCATMVWLTRDGKLRLESDAAVIAMYRRAGWVDAPPPGFEDGEAPQWDEKRRRWRVRRIPNLVSGGSARGIPANDREGTRGLHSAPWETGGDEPWGMARNRELQEVAP